MPSKAAREAYTYWMLADLRYQQEHQRLRAAPSFGEEHERIANSVAALAQAAKDAKERHERAVEQSRDDEAGFF